MYQWDSLDKMKEHFFTYLKSLVPFSYASILLRDRKIHTSDIQYSTILCYPEYFEEAEHIYLKFTQHDPLDWTIYAGESHLLKESDLIEDEKRLNSPLYMHCYRKYKIFDTLQYTIVYKQEYLGVLTLFRTKGDGDFTDDSMFYLRSLGKHLNAVLYTLTDLSNHSQEKKKLIETLKSSYPLTRRECQVLEKIFQYQSNNEIAQALNITENTLLKHIQNIYTKMGVSSKLELLSLQTHH
jgi:ATP/maltotriose-dependent transcriptional regulator MalT